VAEDFSGSLHPFPAFPSFVQEIHCLKVIHPGQEWKKYPGLAFLENGDRESNGSYPNGLESCSFAQAQLAS
jgi:hypothetical protein